MNMTQTIAILAIGISLFANSLQAKPRTCRIVFPERPQDAPKVAYLFDGSNNLSVTLPSMNFSEVIALPGGDLTIALTPTKITDPKVLPANIALLTIPEAVSDFYIILLPDPKNKDFPVKMNLVSTGEGKLNAGETLWYNFTEHRIVAKLGTTDMSIDPKGRTISKGPMPASGYYVARFAFQVNGKGPLAPITEQSWWHDAKSKHLGFMVNTGGKLPKIYFYRDFRDPEVDNNSGPTDNAETTEGGTE